MELGNAPAYGLPCVYLGRDDTKVDVIINYAIDHLAVNHDDEQVRYVVRFPDEPSAELVTEEELAARLSERTA